MDIEDRYAIVCTNKYGIVSEEILHTVPKPKSEVLSGQTMLPLSGTELGLQVRQRGHLAPAEASDFETNWIWGA
jgi:hypothetical protein